MRVRLAGPASAAQIADLHSRASAWYDRNGFVEQAIAHALAIGNETAVVHLVEAHRHVAMNQERWQQLEHWLRLVPRRLIDERPELLLSEAWILQRRWRLADIAPTLDRIEALVESCSREQPASSALNSEADVLRSIVCCYGLDGGGRVDQEYLSRFVPHGRKHRSRVALVSPVGEAKLRMTVHTDEFRDQAALAGVLNTLYDLGFPLLSVECLCIRPEAGDD